MHGNGERDPLDGWLTEQVQPLPPPPGTFELITRRARRRKIRKLAVTVASVAAVAAAVAVAVPGGLLLKLSPSPVSGQNIASGRTPTSSASESQSATGTGTPIPTRTRTPSTTPSTQVGPTAPAGPVPVKFQPSSVTFVSKSTGWAIGQGGTPGHCADANPYFCTSIVRTDDAGQTWKGGPAPKTGAPSGPTGVSGIRYLDGVNGWAFGPELWATHDMGNTWIRVNTQGQRVTDLETVNGRAFALWATCTGTNTVSFAMNCTSYTLMTTTAGSDSWVPVGHQTDGLTNAGNPTSGFIALTGSAGFLVAPDGTLYSGPINGVWGKQGTVRCQPGTPQASGIPGNALFAAADPTHLATACEGIAVTSPPTVYTSDNSGAFWTQQSAAGLQGIGVMTSLTAAPNGTLVLATTNGLYVLPSGGTQWEKAAEPHGVPQGGFTYVGMTTNDQGVAVPADTGLHEIWMTFNGGQSWAPVTPITPGN